MSVSDNAALFGALQTNSILQYRRSHYSLGCLSPRGQTLIKTHINQYGNGAVHPAGEISLHPSLAPSFMSDTAKSITLTEWLILCKSGLCFL
jgi:hypothetical protein